MAATHATACPGLMLFENPEQHMCITLSQRKDNEQHVISLFK